MHRIVLFDSGIGGLSVLPAIKQHIPDADIVYFADHQYSPYGNKEPQWLNTHIVELVHHINQQHNPDAIIIACNTASTLCLNQLRACISTPIIGVVPAIKTAAQLTKTKSIGILATPATIKGPYLDNLISSFAHDCHVTKVASTELVSMAEKKLNKHPIDQAQLANIIKPFLHAECDYVVLGCTHFPHLNQSLNTLAPSIDWIDSADAIAKRCADVLSNTDSPMDHNAEKVSTLFYSSGCIEQGLYQTLQEMGFTQIQQNIVFNHR